jgi:ubiquinone/menaquinone biosynthesis C-methylase UbiE
MQEDEAEKIVRKVRGDYDLMAREWDLSRSRPSQLKLNLLAELREGDLVLDLGCGNAMMLPFVLEKEAYYRGLDISENLLEIARRRYAEEVRSGRAGFARGEATALPYPDEEFDLVISFAVLHHIPSPEMRRKFFSELRRVLRPGGNVRLTVWNLSNPWASSRFEVGAQLEGKTSGDVTVPWKGTRGEIINRYVHQFSAPELLELAEGAGFRSVRLGHFDRGGHEVDNGEEMVLELGN